VERVWFSKLAAVARDTRRILAIAWRMDARLTLLYYLTAFVAALAPVASGLMLARLIDHVVVTSPVQATVPVIIVVVVATHFAIVAINAAVRFGLHEQYYDYVFRYRLQDTFTYRFCEKLTQLDVPHLENPEVQTLITKVRETHDSSPRRSSSWTSRPARSTPRLNTRSSITSRPNAATRR
jgi:ABC-type bacteriocin/lantibiotic exporter with double-glycine peptidase domain